MRGNGAVGREWSEVWPAGVRGSSHPSSGIILPAGSMASLLPTVESGNRAESWCHLHQGQLIFKGDGA